jgi:hypothetical protein
MQQFPDVQQLEWLDQKIELDEHGELGVERATVISIPGVKDRPGGQQGRFVDPRPRNRPLPDERATQYLATRIIHVHLSGER